MGHLFDDLAEIHPSDSQKLAPFCAFMRRHAPGLTFDACPVSNPRATRFFLSDQYDIRVHICRQAAPFDGAPRQGRLVSVRGSIEFDQ
jgi:hypothetical protein